MQLSHANQRRRRVLTDESSASGDASSRPIVAPPSRSHRRIDGYAPGAKLVQQRRLIDLLPNTWLAAGLWLAAGVFAIAALAAGQIWLPAIASRISAAAAVSLDVESRGSLASWLASLWLLAAAIISFQIYSIRRHKLDDYRGRYRWWLLGAAAWFVMSIDATSGIHELFAAIMVHFTGYAGAGGGRIWWLGGSALVLTVLSARLAWEMRVCRLAMWSYLSALALWTIGILVQITGLRLGSLPSELPAEVVKLLGHLSLLFGLGVYARHVILHAQGLLPTRKRRGGKDKPAAAPAKVKTDLQPHISLPLPSADAAETENPEERSVPSDRPSAAVKPSPQERYAALVQETSDISADDEREVDSDADPTDQSGDNRKLSKAERKRLRKQRAREEQGW